MSLIRSAGVAGLTIASTILLAGCAGQEPQAVPAPSSANTVSSAAAPTPTPTPSPTPATGAVVLSYDCGNPTSGLRLEVLDPSSGLLAPLAVYGSLDVSQVPVLCENTSIAIRTERLSGLFSPDYQSVAISIPDQKDNSVHVGYETTDGKITDVSALLSAGGGDFAKSRQDEYPLFDRHGDLVFYDSSANKEDTVGSSGTIARSVTVPDTTRFQEYDSAKDTFVDTANHLQFVSGTDSCAYYPSPDGTHVAKLAGGAGGYYWAAYQWVGDQLLINYDQRLELQRTAPVTSKDELDCTQHGRAFTPTSDFSIEAAIAAPDHSTVLFRATRGTEAGYYSVPLDGSTPPKKIATAQTGIQQQFIGWKQ